MVRTVKDVVVTTIMNVTTTSLTFMMTGQRHVSIANHETLRKLQWVFADHQPTNGWHGDCQRWICYPSIWRGVNGKLCYPVRTVGFIVATLQVCNPEWPVNLGTIPTNSQFVQWDNRCYCSHCVPLSICVWFILGPFEIEMLMKSGGTGRASPDIGWANLAAPLGVPDVAMASYQNCQPSPPGRIVVMTVLLAMSF